MKTFLFPDVVTTELWLVQTENTGATLRPEAARALPTRPKLVSASRTFLQGPLGLQLLSGDISEPVLPHQNPGG